MKENGKIEIVGEKGEKVVCDILFTFDNEETGKSYMVYTDNSKDENGKVRVYASIYDPKNPNSKLEEIKTEKEWKVINTILETLQQEVTAQTE